MTLGDIDVAGEIIDLNFQLLRTQILLEEVLKHNAETMKLPSPEAMNEINEFALKSIQQKFPNMNIGRKEDEPQAEQAE
ncbi:hypothetical protein HX045_14540 [Myroides odoratimimus]|uniref:Uncharacterized protein n=4 Tax=Myroides TaxID=76831 RepID=A0A0S7E8T9_9FLAO|nr:MULTISPECIES: hypothetical protein [Myroides]AJA69098.1 hypothetical protein MYRA21_1962 [Myroides sp. A21]AJH13949.1 hypothetical protein MPR_0754 [Myroides profundi]ALU26334.1 hypothetical protein AS202_09330 [Myroides odoratimimus]APA92386.1 hypothetical protein BK054_09195 [Myroides sp. ZB35]EHO12185.1 hypothetical protein HMPREF9712_00432 [Myroides odoratimimus CCUG 10230]